jgi:hypothetical protein
MHGSSMRAARASRRAGRWRGQRGPCVRRWAAQRAAKLAWAGRETKGQTCTSRKRPGTNTSAHVRYFSGSEAIPHMTRIFADKVLTGAFPLVRLSNQTLKNATERLSSSTLSNQTHPLRHHHNEIAQIIRQWRILVWFCLKMSSSWIPLLIACHCSTNSEEGNGPTPCHLAWPMYIYHTL